MNRARRSRVVVGFLSAVLAGLSLAAWRSVADAAQPRGPIPMYRDPNVKGQSVSMDLSSDERTLFVAVVDPQSGLQILRIPTDSVR